MLLKYVAFVRFCFVLFLLCGICRASLADNVPITPEHQLFEAIEQNDIASVQTLIKQGVNVNVIEDKEPASGQTPLMVAAYMGLVNVAHELIDAGAKVDARDRVKGSVGMTPLMWAAVGNGSENPGVTGVIVLLLQHSANPELREDHGRSALMFAGAEGSSENVTALIKGGAKVNPANEWGETALTYTANNGRFDNFAILIHSGADVNAKEKDGCTPLMDAILSPYVAHNMINFATTQAWGVKMLLESGADVNAVDNKHKTPLAYALKENEPLVANLLRAAGAKK